jgi:hypothetical protein
VGNPTAAVGGIFIIGDARVLQRWVKLIARESKPVLQSLRVQTQS